MIRIPKSQTADTRSCDFKNVSRDTLYASSQQHIADVRAAMDLFIYKLQAASISHDADGSDDDDT